MNGQQHDRDVKTLNDALLRDREADRDTCRKRPEVEMMDAGEVIGTQ